jgi:hypothetical protein
LRMRASSSGHVAKWSTRSERLGSLLRVSRLAELQRLDCATCSGYCWSIWYYPCVADSQYCRAPGPRVLLSYRLSESSELSPYGMDPGSEQVALRMV